MKKGLSSNLYWTIINLARSNVIFRVIIDAEAYIYYRTFRNSKTFTFQGKRFHYFYHPYNRTIASERIVEIPIAKSILDGFLRKNKRVLEVGNVFAHYFPTNYDILDLYEKGPGVINEDVIKYKAPYKYDLIFSVSTMEHVGWTYGEKKNSGKFLKGIENLKKNLAKNGMLVVTFPLYYRDDLSKLIVNKKMPFNREYFMVRTSFMNEWKEVDFNKAVQGNAYDKYYANANVLYIGIYSKSKPVFAKHRVKPQKLSAVRRVKATYRFVKAFFEYI